MMAGAVLVEQALHLEHETVRSAVSDIVQLPARIRGRYQMDT
jgi:hypothetical protein